MLLRIIEMLYLLLNDRCFADGAITEDHDLVNDILVNAQGLSSASLSHYILYYN